MKIHHAIATEILVLILLVSCSSGVSTRPVPPTPPEPYRLSLSNFSPVLVAPGDISEVEHSAYLTDCGIIHLYILKDATGIIVEMISNDISFGDCPDLTERLDELLLELKDEKRLEGRDPVVEFLLDKGTIIPIPDLMVQDQLQGMASGVYLFQP